ncbi:MAG: alpha amylase C-terminal domain-containing protein, partial [Lachnospiraceae bacterium]|nr:alpha amylase C-terminal domain-containing protein [Lachnospiraceae bacterium]
DDGLGFDYRWNLGWAQSFLNYLAVRPEDRPQHYGDLTYTLLYQYSENYILPLSRAAVSGGQPSLTARIPGASEEEKEAGFRAAYGWFMTHPGKKLLTAGQEPEALGNYIRTLNGLYLSHPALWKLDSEPAGFEWINCHSWEENVTAFLRKSGKQEEDLLVIINFRPEAYEKFNVGIPYYGMFREIFNSDAEEFGGSGMRNARPLTAKKLEVDERTEGITVKLAPYGVLIFSCAKRERPVRKAVNSVKETAAAAAESAVETASGAAEIAVEKASGVASFAVEKASDAAGMAMERAGSAVEKASESSDAVNAVLKTVSAAKERAAKTASAARETAAKKASAARETAAKKASAAKETAAKKASAAKETAVKKASAAKETAVKKASAAKKAAVRKVDELRGKDVK